MTRKDFVATAQVIKDAREATHVSVGANAIDRIFDSLARSFADSLEKQNVRFDRKRFLTGCGVQTR